MFYRQCAMFIVYLKNRREPKFQALLRGVKEGESIGPAFTHAYRQSLEDVWQAFVADIRAMKADESPR
jgi:hypothetical protein